MAKFLFFLALLLLPISLFTGCGKEAATRKNPLFAEGLAVINQNGKYGYIDQTGATVIAAAFEDAAAFTEAGLAAVKSNGKYGYINKSGDFVIGPTYDAAAPFSEGLAAVKLNGKYGYIDTNGTFAIAPTFDTASSFDAKGGCVRL